MQATYRAICVKHIIIFEPVYEIFPGTYLEEDLWSITVGAKRYRNVGNMRRVLEIYVDYNPQFHPPLQMSNGT